jgi:hypothetical protein
MCHNGSKVASKFQRDHVSRLLHPLNSPYISPGDFRLFGLLKGVLKRSRHEIEKAILRVWDELTFDGLQSVFHNWTSRPAPVAAVLFPEQQGADEGDTFQAVDLEKPILVDLDESAAVAIRMNLGKARRIIVGNSVTLE